MISNKYIEKSRKILRDRLDTLRERRQDLLFRIKERYPEDYYGVKWLSIYEEQSKKMDSEIKILNDYLYHLHDLDEFIEKKYGEADHD